MTITTNQNTTNQANDLNSTSTQTAADPQIYNSGIPVARGGNPAGYDYPTIASAISAAEPGDTIMLEDGATFHESGLTINENLNFNVFNSGTATIYGNNTQPIFIIESDVTADIENLILENGKYNMEGVPNEFRIKGQRMSFLSDNELYITMDLTQNYVFKF